MNVISGLCFISVGIYIIKTAYKHPDSQMTGITIKGYLAGISSIIFGTLLLLNYIRLF